MMRQFSLARGLVGWLYDFCDCTVSASERPIRIEGFALATYREGAFQCQTAFSSEAQAEAYIRDLFPGAEEVLDG